MFCPSCKEERNSPRYCPACSTTLIRRETLYKTSQILADEPYNKNWQKYETGSGTDNSAPFNFSGCVVSFLTALGIAITLGVAGIFVLGLILGMVFQIGPPELFYCTGVVYIMLFGVIWWAIYQQQQKN
jgi:hypothetical protein